MGADVVGGVPYNDRSAEEHIDTCFALANQYDRRCRSTRTSPTTRRPCSIDYLSQPHHRRGHAVAASRSATPPPWAPCHRTFARVAERLPATDIAVVSLPMTDLHLGGRRDTHNVRRALAPVRALLEAGVNVAAAANNLRNAFTPSAPATHC